MDIVTTDEKKLKVIEKYYVYIALGFSMLVNGFLLNKTLASKDDNLQSYKDQIQALKDVVNATNLIIKSLQNERPKIIDTVYGHDDMHQRVKP